MGSACSTSTPLQTPPEPKSVPTLESMKTLRCLFPQWDDISLREVVLKCHGREDETINHLLSWGNQDNTEIDSSDTEILVLNRQGYDIFMSFHLLRHPTAMSALLTIQAAAKFLAQARLAKRVVAQRRTERGCTADVAFVPKTPPVEIYNSDCTSIKVQEGLLDSLEDGLYLMKQRLDFVNLRMVVMEDDGNCQFRAISYELFGTQRFHHIVRKKVVQHLKSRSDTFSFYVGDDKDWESYLQRMSVPRTWGDELTLTAASEVFHANIHVITTEKSNWLLHYTDDSTGPSRGDASLISSQPKRELFLMYICPIHYNVVAPPELSVNSL